MGCNCLAFRHRRDYDSIPPVGRFPRQDKRFQSPAVFTEWVRKKGIHKKLQLKPTHGIFNEMQDLLLNHLLRGAYLCNLN